MTPSVASLLGALGALELTRPLVLWGLLLAIPLVLFHLYNRRRVVVPFLPLLVEGLGHRRPGGGWRRLREVASLAARILALVLTVLALGGLRPVRVEPPPPSLLLVVDADVTTSAREADGRTRLEHALDRARAEIAADRWADVTVLLAAQTPRLVLAPTTDREAARRRLERGGTPEEASLASDTGAGDLQGAVAAAVAAVGERQRARIAVFTARALPPVDVPAPIELVVLGTGRARDDQGLVDFRVGPAEAGVRSRVIVRVRNDAEAGVSRDLVVRVAEEEVARRTLALGAEAELEASFELLPPRDGAWLHVALAGDDDFGPNDEALAWLAPPRRPSVLIVHDGAVRPYTRAILEAMGEHVDAEASGMVRAADLARAELRDVVVVDGVPLPSGALRPGAWIFLAPLGGDLPFEVGTPVEDPLLWRTAADHPLVRDLDLSTAFVARAFPFTGEGLRPLAEAEGVPVLGEGEHDGVRYVALGLDPDGSDLPVRAALPLLVRNAIERLADAPASPLAPLYRVGAPLRPRLPLPGGARARVRWPGGEAVARLDPEGEAWRVPAGARGQASVATPSDDGPGWIGHTGFVDLDPARTIVPVRAPSAPPPAARPRPSEGLRWRRALLVAAALLLLLDLLLLSRAGRPSPELAPGASAP
ncbi:MAG: hypothetical protein ACYTG6_08195 [Planctomycetota bacterium]|jgi:hypothetical protein